MGPDCPYLKGLVAPFGPDLYAAEQSAPFRLPVRTCPLTCLCAEAGDHRNCREPEFVAEQLGLIFECFTSGQSVFSCFRRPELLFACGGGRVLRVLRFAGEMTAVGTVEEVIEETQRNRFAVKLFKNYNNFLLF